MAEVNLTPKEQPVAKLESKKAFELLTTQEKLYAHYLSQASWHGSLICLHQTSPESWPIFQLLQKHFSSLEDLSFSEREKDEDLNNFLQYAAAFYGNLGNYLSFGDSKFIPRVSREKFRAILEKNPKEHARKEVLELFDQWADAMYSLDPKVLNLGMGDDGISTYYSPNVEKSDVDFVRGFMQEKKISPYNTRLWKHTTGETFYEIKTASAGAKPSEEHVYQSKRIVVSYGDHSEHLAKTVANLKKALGYVANDNQKEMIQKYIDHFAGGDINDHKDSQRAWIRDIQPSVETNIGFIESYRDPQGERGEFEGLVAMVNKEVSKKFGKLVSGAEQFITRLPWPKEFEKDKFLKPDFTSLEVLTFASSGVPAGINIPNYDDIRQAEGFKNVSLGNVLSARGKDQTVEFVEPEDKELYQKLESESFEVQVGIHELLGHGTGKLFNEKENGSKDFPSDMKNPLTGGPITSWYKPGETWDSKFQSWASTVEECRAESVGVYLSTEADLLHIFGHEDAKEGEIHDITYINWLLMARAGLRALEVYNPTSSKWGQAHMQARFSILNVMLEAGQDFVRINKTADNVTVSVDRSKILSVGRPAVGKFLQTLQVYKSTGDFDAMVSFYSKYCTPSSDFIALRDIVLSRKKPRAVFVQDHTKVNGTEVTLEDFEGSASGLIQSFVTRFA